MFTSTSPACLSPSPHPHPTLTTPSPQEGDQLHSLLSEADSILGSAAFRITLADLLTNAFEAVQSELSRSLTQAGAPLASRSLQLAKLLSQFHKIALSSLSSVEPVALGLLATPSLDEFCWMAYSGE